MTTVPRLSSVIVTIGQLTFLVGGLILGVVVIMSILTCPMTVLGQSSVPPSCLPGGSSFLWPWEMVVSPWAMRGHALVGSGLLSVVIGRHGDHVVSTLSERTQKLMEVWNDR